MAKENIYTVYGRDGLGDGWRELEALEGEIGVIVCQEAHKCYTVRFSEWTTVCLESELDFLQ